MKKMLLLLGLGAIFGGHMSFATLTHKEICRSGYLVPMSVIAYRIAKQGIGPVRTAATLTAFGGFGCLMIFRDRLFISQK